ncbi:hypothetical protein Tco_0020144 [Tanacetum coccineum]
MHLTANQTPPPPQYGYRLTSATPQQSLNSSKMFIIAYVGNHEPHRKLVEWFPKTVSSNHNQLRHRPTKESELQADDGQRREEGDMLQLPWRRASKIKEQFRSEVKAFLVDVECTAPYDQPLAITTTNMFEVSHEDAYDSDVDEGPHAAAAFMANLSSTSDRMDATHQSSQ